MSVEAEPFRMNYTYKLVRALNPDTNRKFCPLFIEAELPFLAIYIKKKVLEIYLLA